MRIAMLTNNYKPFIGGVPISIERLSQGLREIGHEVFIFAPEYEENREIEEGVIRYNIVKGNKDTFVIPNIFDSKIEEEFGRLNIDVIHVHHPMLMGWIGLYLGKRYKIPVVLTYHTRYEQYLHNLKIYSFIQGRYAKEKIKWLKNFEKTIMDFTYNTMVPGVIKSFCNKCDLVFAPTRLIKKHLENSGVGSQIDVLPTGLNNEYFNEDLIESRKIREKYIGDKKYLFCTVSRLTKEKNIEFIINGLRELKNRMGNSFKLLIIGQGILKEKLKNKAEELGIGDNVEFLNSIDNKKIGNYYRACDLFLFASKSETQGIVLLEAMAAKIPVVAVEASGVCDVVRNGINGYMTEEDESEWVDKITYLLDNKSAMKNAKVGAYKTSLSYLNSIVAEVAGKSYESVLQEHYKEGQAYECKVTN